MANISIEITSILSDTRGEDVRDSFVSACEKINDELLPDASQADVGKILAVDSAGKWTALSVTPVLSSIAITAPPDKVSYNQGDPLDLAGIVITATKTSDLVTTTDVVTNSCIFVPADETILDESGTMTVGVSYTDDNKTVNTSFEIIVTAAETETEPEGET